MLVRKSVVLIITKPIAKFNKPAAAVAAAVPAIDLSYATKVNVSGLPKDLKHDNIKVCFQTENLEFSVNWEKWEKFCFNGYKEI